MAVYKRLLLATLIISLIFLWIVAFANKGASELLEDENAASYYRAFLKNATSGVVTKYSIGFDNWIDIISAKKEKLRFATNAQDEYVLRKLTYSSINPIVFFYLPSPDYYNGTQYYYKHNGKWSVDNSIDISDYVNSSYYGVPPEMLDENKITRNFVYKTKNGYSIEIISADTKNNLKYIITGNTDKNKNFKNIFINVINTDKTKKIGDKKFFVFYSQINNKVTIKQPSDLYNGITKRNDGDIEYRLQDYRFN